jgi:hypothetical protein
MRQFRAQSFPLFAAPLMLCAALILAAPLRATTLAPAAFDDQLAAAEIIFRGKVIDQVSRWQTTPHGRAIFTDVTFDTLETFKGFAPARYTLELLGGKIGDDELIVDGLPRFVSGHEYIVLVSGNGTAACPVVGWRNGSLPITRETGQAVVELPPAAADAAPALRRRSTTAGPDTASLDAFSQHLREKLKAHSKK